MYWTKICIFVQNATISETQFLPLQLIQTPLCQDTEQDQQIQDVREDSIASNAA